MISEERRKKDFIKLIKKLDISPTMFKNAKEKYQNIANYLERYGLNVDIYPQGSFALGTVVRPYKGNKDVDYDLDCICLLKVNKNEITPKVLKKSIGKALLDNKKYNIQEEWDKCWTIEYADINNIGFNIDVVPAVNEDSKTIERLQKKSIDSSKVGLSIAITNKIEDDEYKWTTNNPKGYKQWFDELNKPFQQYNRDTRRYLLFEENRDIFNSVEEIPEELERSALQRVIQIMKRHRDIYFSKVKMDNSNKSIEEYKPISAIITTLVARIAESASPTMDVFELLKYISDEFDIYSKQQFLSESQFNSKYVDKRIIQRAKGVWKIENPVNPEDNLADSWNDEPNKAKYFFMWLNQIKKDFIDSFKLEDSKFISLLESSLGSQFVNNSIDSSLYYSEPIKPLINNPKPWRL